MVKLAPRAVTYAGREIRVSVKRDAHESVEFYEALILKAFDVCTEISRYQKPSHPSAIKIWEVANGFVSFGSILPSAPQPYPATGAAFEALDKLRMDWPELSSGAITGETAYGISADLWQRLMCESPMGTYACLAAGLVNSCIRPGHKIIELGAGVGNASRLLEIPPDVLYIRSDKNPFLLNRRDVPGTFLRYDFDFPSSMTAADIVFAVNALHCAQNPRRTLSYVREMLRHGGTLVLAEGVPRPARNRPWALDVLFCQFKGWWDRSGFRNRSEWIDDLHAAGYTDVGYQRLLAGEYDLGGVIWARC